MALAQVGWRRLAGCCTFDARIAAKEIATDVESWRTRIGTPRYLARSLLVLIAYFVTGRLGLSLDAVSGVAATVWPPSGIALAALLLGGRSLWPAVALGAFSVNLSVGVPAAAAAGITLGNTLEAVVGAHLVGRFGRFRDAPFDTIRDALVLVMLAGFLSTTQSATIGTASVWLAGKVSGDAVGRVWWNWWVGDVLGVLLVTPLVFGVRALGRQSWSQLRLLEACLALAVLCGVGALIFGADPSSRIVLHAYFVFPPLLWAALRFGQPGAAVATFVLAATAILGTAEGFGPFVGVHASREPARAADVHGERGADRPRARRHEHRARPRDGGSQAARGAARRCGPTGRGRNARRGHRTRDQQPAGLPDHEPRRRAGGRRGPGAGGRAALPSCASSSAPRRRERIASGAS